jgi:hypothetical protein
MSKTPAELQREQRLAAKLRENLKRRKLQARARAAAPEAPAESAQSANSPAPPGAATEPDPDC